MFYWLKMLIAGEEIRELERYRTETEEAMRWLVSSDPDAAATAQWIRQRATIGDVDISRWRDALAERKFRRMKANGGN